MKSHGDLPLEEYQALAEFRFQIRRFTHFSEQAARAAGLEPQQQQLLLAVKGFPAGECATVGGLAERLQLQHHSAVELVGRSAKQGLVARSRGTTDRRQVFVALTPYGETLLRDLTLHHRRELRSAGPALVRALNALLEDAMSPPIVPGTGEEAPTPIP